MKFPFVRRSTSDKWFQEASHWQGEAQIYASAHIRDQQKIASLQKQLAEKNELACVLQSQVDNADVNLRQCLLNFKDEIQQLKKEITIKDGIITSDKATIQRLRTWQDAQNLCPNHRDKQRNKQCNACTIETIRNHLISRRVDIIEAPCKFNLSEDHLTFVNRLLKILEEASHKHPHVNH